MTLFEYHETNANLAVRTLQVGDIVLACINTNQPLLVIITERPANGATSRRIYDRTFMVKEALCDRQWPLSFGLDWRLVGHVT